MKITKFLLSAPDSDGAMSSTTTVTVANPTKEDVRWIQFNSVFSDKDGFPLQCSNGNEEDCTIEPGEDFQISPWGSDIPSQVVGTGRDNVTLTVSGTLYAREFFKLGEIEVPTTDLTATKLERQINSSTIEGPIKAMLFRQKTDDEGQTKIDCRVFVRNKSDLHLAKVEVKCDLLDADDAVTDNNSDQLVLPARSIVCIETGSGWLKKSQFKGAKMRVSLSVFRPIHTAQCSATSAPSED